MLAAWGLAHPCTWPPSWSISLVGPLGAAILVQIASTV